MAWLGESLGRLTSAIGDVASGCGKGSVVVRGAGQRCSSIEGILTGVMARQDEVGGRKESFRSVRDNPTQNNRKGEVVARHYGVVKIPRAESGVHRTE